VIRKTSVDITIYNLYSRRLSIPPQIETRYNNAISFLQRVLEGKISLGDSAVEATQENRILTNTYVDDKFFSIGSIVLDTHGTLDDW
jgi:phage gp36-like protein